MRIENIEVYGFKAALRGMRNPMESWEKSDSQFDLTRYFEWDEWVDAIEYPLIGPNDMKLALSLISAGGSHRKFLRQIMVWWDITIPRAIWQELDTYKVATVRNSCSTMHKLGTRDLEPCDFEDEEITASQLDLLNRLGAEYRADKKPERLHRLKMQLPESFLQKATYSFNYETAIKMWWDRHTHKMREWSGIGSICGHIQLLPYMPQFIDAAR